MTASDHFAQTYALAREKFLAAVQAAGLEVTSHVHPLLGRDGETLAMDVSRLGPADAQGVLILSSACHGVEGFCGSGVQVALLGDAGFLRDAAERGVAVLFIHALNPHGFSWWRRTTHENVDLNRNFRDAAKPPVPNAGYDEIAHALVPEHWPPQPQDEAVLADYTAQHGARGLQQAISSGQTTHPEGLFYAGRNPTWSQQTVRQVLREHATHCARLAWIDLHTGLGPSGLGERIFAGHKDDDAGLARARAWWGSNVTSIYDGSSTAAVLEGEMWRAAYEECAQAVYTGIALEYGTVPLDDTLYALRAEQWLENHPETPDERRQEIKRALRDAFYTDDPVWKQRILEQGKQVAGEALRGLAG
jgi:hypothetical protein